MRANNIEMQVRDLSRTLQTKYYQEIYKKTNIRFFENKLNSDTVSMAACCDGVCAFVNDTIDRAVIDKLEEYGVGIIAMRCAGYNNVDLKAAAGRIRVRLTPWPSTE